jgi:hypothetical protein
MEPSIILLSIVDILLQRLMLLGAGYLKMARTALLYYFDQFSQKLAFLHFRKISENQKNREKIKSRIKKNWCDA